MDDVLYADIYEDVKSGKIVDPRIRPPLPPKPNVADGNVGNRLRQQPPKRPPPKQKPKAS